uniref:ATP-dependent protease La domain-containing family protein n=1 Tax=Rhizophora mucronata TaxID=61149 RepID=A0A2P2K258_RHIMU
MEDDDAIPEAERHQIAHIRELEFEELEVEEVDDSSDDGGSASFASPTNVTFNTSLASLHTYLGEVEDTHRRLAFLDGGAILTIPLFHLEGVVLFPEATLPLRIVQPNFLTAVERTLTQVDAPYIIGVVHLYSDLGNRRFRFATVGTTAEIRQTRFLENGYLNVVTRGQQRFRLRRHWIDAEGVHCGEVQIIQEDLPLRTPRDVVGKLLPLSNLSSQCLSHMLPSAGSLRGQDSDNDWDSNSEKSFEVELSKAERAVHQSAVDSCCDIIDELQSSDNDNAESDSEMRSTRTHLSDTDSIGPVHSDHEKKIGNAVLEIGKGSTSGNLSDIRGQKRYWTNQHLSQFRKVPRAFWPPWVYGMYDSYSLAQKAAGNFYPLP